MIRWLYGLCVHAHPLASLRECPTHLFLAQRMPHPPVSLLIECPTHLLPCSESAPPTCFLVQRVSHPPGSWLRERPTHLFPGSESVPHPPVSLLRVCPTHLFPGTESAPPTCFLAQRVAFPHAVNLRGGPVQCPIHLISWLRECPSITRCQAQREPCITQYLAQTVYLPPDACPRVTKQMSLLPNCWLSQSYPRTHSTILSSIQEVVLLTHWLSHPSATFPSTVFPPSHTLWGPHAPILEEFLGTQCLRGAHPSSHGCAFSAHPPSLVLQMK